MSETYTVPRVSYSVNNHTSLQKYKDKKNPLTNVHELEIEPFKLELKGERERGNSYYGLRIVTGRQEGAGTMSHVYVVLIGSKGQTGKIYVGHYLNFLYSSDSTYDDYIISCVKSLGDIQVVTIGMDDDGILDRYASWYVDFSYVVNLRTKEGQHFPCYHWIGAGDYFSLAANCGTLKQVKNKSNLVNQRQKQVANRKETYIWDIFSDSGVPSGIDIGNQSKPPLDEKFEKVKDTNFLGKKFEGAAYAFSGAIFEKLQQELSSLLGIEVSHNHSAKSLHDFHNIAALLEGDNTLGNPNLEEGELIVCEASRWTSDVEFGRQILNGVNCVIIKRCTELPDNFPVKNEMVKNLLSRGLTLEQEMEEENVYICDLSEMMDGLPCQEGYYCAAPLCLLYVNPTDRLVPIAIQLNRMPAEDNPIFLPNDTWIDWLLAKIYFTNASAQYHQLSTHYISCHAAMEAYGVAMMRTIPDSHPVYKLLRPAFHYTMAINTAARRSLINDGGTIDQAFSIGTGKSGEEAVFSGKNELFKRVSQKYSVHWTNIKRDMKARGVGDADKLPHYYYRDDGVRLWDAIENFVKSILKLFYDNGADVRKDSELKEWAEEVHNNAFPAFCDNPSGRGFPLQITEFDELVEYCTLIIFTGSVQHSAVNFGQFQMYAFVPNSPFNLRKPLPTKKGEATLEYLLEALPTYLSAGLAVTVVFALSQFSPDEVFLGGYPTMWYTGKKEKACVKSFLDSLATINADTIERNKRLEIPYKYLLSYNCPNSITI